MFDTCCHLQPIFVKHTICSCAFSFFLLIIVVTFLEQILYLGNFSLYCFSLYYLDRGEETNLIEFNVCICIGNKSVRMSIFTHHMYFVSHQISVEKKQEAVRMSDFCMKILFLFINHTYPINNCCLLK